MKKIGVIIPAGGSGIRMGSELAKQFVLLAGLPVMARCVTIFHEAVNSADIVVAMNPRHFETWARLCHEYKVAPHKLCEGGQTRHQSVRNALRELDPECSFIAVHDAVRPLLSRSLIDRTMATARKHGSAVPVLEVTDSIRHITETGSYRVDRSPLRAVQTPQVFRADILRTAYERAVGEDFTDDASVVESVGYNIKLCDGERSNIKITTPVDLTIAEAILDNDRQ